MKAKLFILIFGAILLASCQQKEMKISRSDFSVVTEMTDFSPAYILKNEEGTVEIKKNSLIGNTHWVLSVDRDLTMNEVAPFLQELTKKKHKKGGMHEDTKDIYFVYSDTVHKQNAYVKMPFVNIDIEIPSPPKKDPSKYFKVLIKSYPEFLENISEFLERNNDDTKLHIMFDKNISTEDFVNILVEIKKQNINKRIDTFTSFL